MIKHETISRLEGRLTQLVAGMLDKKRPQMDFLIGLNRLDDILVAGQDGQPIEVPLREYFEEHRSWLEESVLDEAQGRRFGKLLEEIAVCLNHQAETGPQTISDLNQWLRKFAHGSIKLTLKNKSEEASLADRFYSLLRRESEELNMLLAEHDHLLTVLDDLLLSAEAKTDGMYKHLAASLIYFLKHEGYKVDPYVKRLRNIQSGSQ